MIEKHGALDHIRIVLSHTSHPGNIGAAARAMKTMGLGRLYLINPKHFPHKDADAMACGAQDILTGATVCATLDEALNGAVLAAGVTARRRDLSHKMYSARDSASWLLEQTVNGDIALVFGTEMSGLTNAELDKCQRLVTIPSNPECSSLNLAAAVQVMAYELFTASAPAQHKTKEGEPAALEEVENFYRHLEQTLIRIGFLDPQHPKRLMSRLRRLYARAAPEKEEVSILRGILTETNKKIVD